MNSAATRSRVLMWLTAVTATALLTACGAAHPVSQATPGANAHTSARTRCSLCRSQPLGGHAAFVIGTLAVPGACPGDVLCPPPIPKPIIERTVRIARRGDVEVSGVLDATNPTRSQIELVLGTTINRGTKQRGASVHGSPQETIAKFPAKQTSNVSYQFVFPNVAAGSHLFSVNASATAKGASVGSISLVIQTLS